MQSSLEFYLSPQVPKLSNPFGVPSDKLKGYEEVSILQLYQLHVQQLFDYGMQVRSNRELVTESLLAVFVQVRNQDNLPGMKKSLRLFLFKIFRKHVADQMFALKKVQLPCESPNESDDTLAGCELSAGQREAIFLKIKCEFSYQEVAAIMDIKIKSAYNLVSQAVENMRGQMKEA